jgi:hypothetical protein
LDGHFVHGLGKTRGKFRRVQSTSPEANPRGRVDVRQLGTMSEGKNAPHLTCPRFPLGVDLSLVSFLKIATMERLGFLSVVPKAIYTSMTVIQADT